MDPLESHIVNHCQRHPAAVSPLADLLRSLRSHNPQAAMTRTSVIARLTELGYVVGDIGGQSHVAGLAVGRWRVRAGRLTQTTD